MVQCSAIMSKGIMKSYNGNEALKNCTMTVKQGQIYALLGPNGAGKTTAFKILTGLVNPSAGEGSIMGFDIRKDRTQIQRIVGSIIETPIFYEHLSATENIKMHIEYMGVDNKDIDELLRKVGLSNTGDKSVSQFSLGMKQRLGIARALSHSPKLLILDEPINGLDPMGIVEMRKLFISLKEAGVTIIISSHILSEVEQIADVIGVISEGTVIQEIAMSNLRGTNGIRLEDYFMNIFNRGEEYV